MPSRSLSLLTIACLSALIPLHADVQVPAIFGDHMVLQQDATLPVWGTAEPGEKVSVTVGDKSAETTAGADGKWRVNLAKLPVSATPVTMTIKGKNTLQFQDAVVGDVWVCAGQSNMAYQMRIAHNAQTELPAAKDPLLRVFAVAPKLSLQPLATLGGSWQLCTPESVREFTAVGYFFGRELRATQNKPIGLIGTYWGGSTAQAWTSLSGLQKDPPIERYVALYKTNSDNFAKLNDRYPERLATYNEELKKWKEAGNQKLFDAWRGEVAKAHTAHLPAPPQNFPPRPLELPVPGGDQKSSANLFNGMVNPFIPYAIKGVIWYQGEYNTDDPMEYYTLFPRLIGDWREKWGQGDFPFLYVQLPALFVVGQMPRLLEADNWDLLRDSQLKSLAVPNTGMAVAMDLGGGLHPPDKLDVAKRLSLVARRVVYGEKVIDSGPVFTEMKVEGPQIRLSFTRPGDEKLAIGTTPYKGGDGAAPVQPKDKLGGFIVAGADKKWVDAEARLDGDTVIVSSAQVAAPVAVRYGWGSGVFDAECNLYSASGLPASPFRTDDWDDVIPVREKARLAALKTAKPAPPPAAAPVAPVTAPK